jgi:hypothetical protein
MAAEFRRKAVLKPPPRSANTWEQTMDKRPLIIIPVLAVLAALTVIAYQRLEIYPRAQPVFPSREAAANEYLALERWLAETGHPVRVTKRAAPSRFPAAPETVIAVNARTAAREDTSALLPWIDAGGFLIIFLDGSGGNLDGSDGNLAAFLASFGIIRHIPDADSGAEDADEAEDSSGEAENLPRSDGAPVPDFDSGVRFSLAEPVHAGVTSLAAIRDERGVIRLARAVLGNGGIAVTGRPLFMANQYLGREINARLSWELTAAMTTQDKPGILFIREQQRSRGLFGNIAERGNILPPGLALALLVIIGFWMTVPVFGLQFSEAEPVSRPPRERFAAETRFLQKYGGLESYLETYLREIKLWQNSTDNQYIEAIEQALAAKRRLSSRECTAALKKLAVHWSKHDGAKNGQN